MIRSSRSWRGVHADESSSLLRSHLTTLETAPRLQLRSMHRKFRVMSAGFKGTRRSINTSWTEKMRVFLFFFFPTNVCDTFSNFFIRISSSPIQRRFLINRSKRSRRENVKFSLERFCLTAPFSRNSSRNRDLYIKIQSFEALSLHSFEFRCQVIIEGSRINVKFVRGWTNPSSRLWVFCGFLTAGREVNRRSANRFEPCTLLLVCHERHHAGLVSH